MLLIFFYALNKGSFHDWNVFLCDLRALVAFVLKMFRLEQNQCPEHGYPRNAMLNIPMEIQPLPLDVNDTWIVTGIANAIKRLANFGDLHVRLCCQRFLTVHRQVTRFVEMDDQL